MLGKYAFFQPQASPLGNSPASLPWWGVFRGPLLGPSWQFHSGASSTRSSYCLFCSAKGVKLSIGVPAEATSMQGRRYGGGGKRDNYP